MVVELTANDYFSEAVGLVLSRWSALEIALEHQTAGPNTIERKNELHTFIVDFFNNYGVDVEVYELANNFNGYFDEIFHIGLEDGSENEVSRHIYNLYRDIVINHKTEELLRLRNLAHSQRPVSKGNKVSNGDDSSDSEEGKDGSEDEMMEVEPSVSTKMEPIIDEDGFELVQKKGRSRK